MLLNIHICICTSMFVCIVLICTNVLYVQSWPPGIRQFLWEYVLGGNFLFLFKQWSPVALFINVSMMNFSCSCWHVNLFFHYFHPVLGRILLRVHECNFPFLCRIHYLLVSTLVSWNLQSSYPVFIIFTKSYMYGFNWRCINWNWASWNYLFYINCKKVFGWWVRAMPIPEYNNKYW